MSVGHKKDSNEGFMLKLARFIVDKRNLFFLITTIGIIFSFISKNWIQVENELAAYLPDDCETRKGLDVMEEQFTTFGSAQIMIANLSLEEAEKVENQILGVEGVQSVEFDDSTDHYNHVSALYTVTFDYDENDNACLEALEATEKTLDDYDVYVLTALGDSLSEIIDAEVSVIMVIVAIIVVIVLTLTSQTYAEILVLLLTFITAMILNQGTNFLLGEISFVSNSVTSILQLALSLDYAIILCNRYREERQTLPQREAVIVALSKAIPEISSSSLTTIGGLIALMFMQFQLGPDMAICLIKAILFALLAVFIVMPGLLMVFGRWMEKTKHKNFVPKISFVGKFAYKTRKTIPAAFLVILILAAVISSSCPYVYGYGDLETPKLNDMKIAENMIADNFTSTNMVALVVPTEDYDSEALLLAELEEKEEVDYTVGLSNVEAMDGYMLTDKLTPRQFAELVDLDYEMAQVIYSAYAVGDEDYSKLISDISSYKVPLIEMFIFVCEQVNEGVISLGEEQETMLREAYTQMTNAKLQLQGTEYNRVLIYLNLPEGGQETYDFIDTIRETAEKYYPSGNVYVVGDSTTEYDFQKSFSKDNKVVSIVTILIVLAVLLFTFKSVAMPILLILVIQGAIWINFSFPTITGNPIFYELFDCYIHSNGCQYRLCDRDCKPLYGT